MAKILIVEDEQEIRELVSAYLRNDQFEVDAEEDGKMALNRIKSNHYDLIILDLMLPSLSGEKICEEVRTFSNVPILMLTAKSDLSDKVFGFRIGADDYLTKPFEPIELLERVRALLRRSRNDRPKATLLRVLNGRILIDTESLRVTKDGVEIPLTTNEFKILMVLLSNPNRVFSRDEIIEQAFGMEYDSFDRAIDTHIKNIRAKLEDDSKHPMMIKTIYGAGYRAELTYDTEA